MICKLYLSYLSIILIIPSFYTFIYFPIFVSLNCHISWLYCICMHQVFNPSTHIAFVRTTGNVFCYEAIEELNFKAKNYKVPKLIEIIVNIIECEYFCAIFIFYACYILNSWTWSFPWQFCSSFGWLVVWSGCLSQCPKRVESFTSMLQSKHLFFYRLVF